MNILVIGEVVNFHECRAKFGEAHAYACVEILGEDVEILDKADVIFDFTLGKNPVRLKMFDKKAVFFNAVENNIRGLARAMEGKIECDLFGFNGMPTLFNRPILEVSLLNKDDENKLRDICKNLNTDYLVVEDKIGLVTPRVICMIINEAYFTVEEGVASREDIDNAMKLGTNYPFGPFEWCKKIGIKKVCELLEAVYHDTKDERYKICSLLKAESTYQQTGLSADR